MSVASYVPAITYTDTEGEHRVLLDRPSTSIGRAPTQDIILTDAFVSRQHALIVREAGIYEVVDQNSSHGTFLNGIRVHRAPLNPDDILQCGSPRAPRIRFHLHQTATHDNGPSSRPPNDLLTTLSSTLSNFQPPASDANPAARPIEQLNFLLSAARQLNSGGAINDILAALLQLTLQLTGVERGFVFLRPADGQDGGPGGGQDGEMHFALGLHADGTPVPEDSTVSRSAIQSAIDSGGSFYLSDTLSGASASASIMANKIRSIFCLPLRKRITPGALDQPAPGEAPTPKAQSELLGLLYLDSQLKPGHLTEIDHQLLDAIATEAAALLHNALLADAEQQARRAREELSIAARIHTSLMSIKLPVLPYAVLKATSKPCLAIGGDFYDAVALSAASGEDDCVCVTMADVSGKGVSAAIVAATLQGIIHALMLTRQTLPEIASLINQFLCTRQVGKYATMVMLKLYPDGRLEYLNCGHIQPVLVYSGEANSGDPDPKSPTEPTPIKSIRRLEEANLVVGLISTATYDSTFTHLRPGERILLTTDGVTEAENPEGTPFGNEGFDTIAHEPLESIFHHISHYQHPNEPQDDCTLLEIRYEIYSRQLPR